VSIEGKGATRSPDLNVIITLKSGERMVAYRTSMSFCHFLQENSFPDFNVLGLDLIGTPPAPGRIALPEPPP